MPTKHLRFALHDVTFAGVPLPSATMDLWQDDHGVNRWSVRALMPVAQQAEVGRLTGRTKDGRSVSGDVDVANRQMGPSGPRGQTLVELHGAGPLEGLDVPPPD
ncbi:MAG TPA: hypothetical protein VGQ64_06000 [Candidatus Limnocylindrales bacterium]|nr:hypothetical protein [Candidatus Limnocylindrales bacterium]